MADDVKRLSYFNGQFLRAADFDAEQGYHLQLERDHVRLMHTAGIAEGLDIPDPPPGSTAVTVQPGIAYDDLGRRMVMASNLTLSLQTFTPNADVYITIAYREQPSDRSSEAGTPGDTRITETPLVEPNKDLPAEPNRSIVLGRIARSGTSVASVDRSPRVRAGGQGTTAQQVTIDAIPGTPRSLAAGTLRSGLAALLDFINSGPTEQGTVTGTGAKGRVPRWLAENGSELVDSSIADSNGMVTISSELTVAGTIRQASGSGSSRTLLWAVGGAGGAGGGLRVYADQASVWFTINASWNGNAWVRDDTGQPASGFRLSGGDFELINESTATAPFADFARKWTLPMSAGAAAFSLTGKMKETGWLSLRLSNSHPEEAQYVGGGASITFRNRLVGVRKELIRLTRLDESDPDFEGDPLITNADEDGFCFLSNQRVPAGMAISWIGKYTVEI